ncbi:MAG: Flp pilus assembly protein TadD [Pseudohongiellaceae bacterium]
MSADTPTPPTRPVPPDPRFLAALKARRNGDTSGARARLEAILEEEPDHTEALEILAMLLSEGGDNDAAILITTRLAELQPESIMAHANLSRFYMLKGDKDTAEEWQAKARVLGWKDEVARKAAAGGAAEGVGDLVDPATVERQEKAVSTNPDDALARQALAGSYLKLGMPAKAVAQLRKAMILDDTRSVVYLSLGKALEASGMKGDAMEIYRTGVPLADRNGDLMPRNQMASRLAALEKPS